MAGALRGHSQRIGGSASTRPITGVAGLGSIAAAHAVAVAHAPFLRAALANDEVFGAELIAAGPDAALASLAATPLSGEAVALRDARLRLAVTVALADLAGLWSLERVTATLSDFADRAIDAAIRAALGGDSPDGFVALALGKLGAGELNYSSDVDLILLHDPALIDTRRAQAVARRMTALLSERVGGRHVARVDLRLRPASEATPAVLPLGAAIGYYQSEALGWERVAFIRARPCAGDLAMGARFLAEIAPFVWRRNLDFAALTDIRRLSARMRDAGQGTAGGEPGPGFDLKRGRGGIREIEFFAHAHQLIFGGREAALRVRGTIPAYDALATAGHVDATVARDMVSSYQTLRTIEHRLQMRGDEQTHSLPLEAAVQADAAALSGLPDFAALVALIARTTSAPARHYGALVAEAPASSLPHDPDALAGWLAAAGAREIPAVIERIGVWRSRRYRALRSDDARAAFEAVLPDLLRRLLGDASAPGSLARFDALLAALPSGVALFELMRARPALVDLLGTLLGVTPVLSDALARRPDLFDVALDDEPLPAAQGVAALTAELAALCAGQPLDLALDRVRRWAGERQFLVGARLVTGRADPLDAGRDYAAIAEAVVATVAPAVEAAFAAAHGHVPGERPLIVALGRFGGGLLTPRSDLDVVFLFTGSFEAVSDGPRPLGATLYFNRLAGRLIAALSSPGPAGPLYVIDTRLRPSGEQGLLAVSVDSFVTYQQADAWTWERMALTRARVLGDHVDMQARIAAALATPRDPLALRRDVLAMRADMAAAHPEGGVWDVKHGRGGLIDLEFLIHYRQLRDGVAITPDLRAAIAGLRLGDTLLAAHDLLTRLLVMARLLVADTSGASAAQVDALTPAARDILARACGSRDLETLRARVTRSRGDVVAAWASVFGEPRT